MYTKSNPIWRHSGLKKVLTLGLLCTSLTTLSPVFAATVDINDPIIQPINHHVAASQTDTLPNAYALQQKINAQQVEIARLAGQIETLDLRLSDLNKLIETQLTQTTDSDSNSELKSINANNNLTDTARLNESTGDLAQIRQDIYNELYSELYVQLSAQIKHDINQASHNQRPIDASQTPQPYLNRLSAPTDKTDSRVPLLTNADIIANQAPDNTTNSSTGTQPRSNPLTEVSTMSQGDKAYADAYMALQQDGADAAVAKMKSFIATYSTHPKIPNAHYWLGEFYLQQSPPDVTAAKQAFEKVVGEYEDYPSNDSQSKALFRLLMFALDNDQIDIAKDYSERLISQYPLSKEAELARQLPW